MKIFVTGGTGLLGSAICRALLVQGHEVTGLHRPTSKKETLGKHERDIHWVEGDIGDVLGLENAMKSADAVVHAAAMVTFEPRKADIMHRINVSGTANVVNAALATGVKRFCHISSVAALGRNPDPKHGHETQKINENQRWTDSTKNSTYAKTKYHAELEVRRGEAEGLPVVIINPSMVLGEGDPVRSSTRLFKYVHDENLFYTNGLLNYVDVRDVAAATVAVLFSSISGERFILSAGSISYHDFFREVAECLDKKAPSRYVGPRLSEVIWRLEAIRSWVTGKQPIVTSETAQISHQRYIYDGSKAQNKLKMTYTPLAETLRRVCASFLW